MIAAFHHPGPVSGLASEGGAAPAHPWDPPNQRSLPEVLAERIVEAIRTGILKSGERIVEVQLSRQLGVSRGPLREALKVLEANQIVESRRGRGSFVKQVSNEDLLRMVTLRAGLEGLAARSVASTITPEILGSLSRRLDEMKRLARRGRISEWRDQDWRFHEAICTLADNPFLLTAWRSISNLVRLFLHTHPGFVHESPRVLSNHDTLLAALASGDPDAAERSFRAIILTSALERLDMDIPPALTSVVPVPDVASSDRRAPTTRSKPRRKARMSEGEAPSAPGP